MLTVIADMLVNDKKATSLEMASLIDAVIDEATSMTNSVAAKNRVMTEAKSLQIRLLGCDGQCATCGPEVRNKFHSNAMPRHPQLTQLPPPGGASA
jgi:ferredoxin